MPQRNKPKVNWHNADLMFAKQIEQARKDKTIKKPIAWALYHTWKWAEENEEARENEQTKDGCGTDKEN